MEDKSYVLKFSDLTAFIDSLEIEPKTSSILYETAARANKETAMKLSQLMASKAYEVDNKNLKYIGMEEKN